MYFRKKESNQSVIISVNFPSETGSDWEEVSKLNPEISQLLTEYFELESKKCQMKKKIICTLEKLKSYSKIRDNYPEAYTLLIELDKKWNTNKSSEEKVILCDSVENLRAELSSFK